MGAPGEDFFTASTGIIGWQLPVAEMRCRAALPRCRPAGLVHPSRRACHHDDRRLPEGAQGRASGRASIVGVAKGAGMIEPNMATLLCFLCTDVAVDRDLLRESLAWCVERTLNRISVDSDQSTSDTVLAFASGRRGPVGSDELRAALLAVLSGLAGGHRAQRRGREPRHPRERRSGRATRPWPSASGRPSSTPRS